MLRTKLYSLLGAHGYDVNQVLDRLNQDVVQTWFPSSRLDATRST